MVEKFLMSLFLVLFWGAPAQASQDMTLMHDGLERTYIVQSASRQYEGLRPLVILFHGGTQSARKVWRQTTFPQIAQQNGVVLIAPNAIDGVWNDGRDQYLSTPQRPVADDVGFAASLIKNAIAEYNVDPQRVYVTGASNGGFMSFFTACKLSGVIAAAAPVIATMTTAMESQCIPKHAVSVQLIAGTKDPFVPFEGGDAEKKGKGGRTVGGHISAPDAIRFWAQHNDCTLTPIKTYLPNISRQDHSKVRREVFPDCQHGVEAIFYVIEGGGHRWPTLKRRRSARLFNRFLGPQNRDLDSAALIWSFFESKRVEHRAPQ